MKSKEKGWIREIVILVIEDVQFNRPMSKQRITKSLRFRNSNATYTLTVSRVIEKIANSRLTVSE